MRRSEFYFELPEELIAQQPLPQRDAARMLVLDGETGRPSDHFIVDLPEFIHPEDLLVFNDTRVIPARLLGHKASGGKVEVLVERVLDEERALVQVRASKSPRTGTQLVLEETVEAEVLGRDGEFFELGFRDPRPVHEILDAVGRVPLPPYIRRRPDESDQERYQTVYALRDGAVAAPTAGLHFDEELLDRLRAVGARVAFVTLHVGAATFQPVRVEEIDDHTMHSEYAEVSEPVVEMVRETRERGGRVVAVGTTTVRALESASAAGQLAPFAGETRIFIFPGYRFRCVDALVTNFHLPESTLLMLVCAFAGTQRVLSAYRHAVERSYRFFSYGDAMFVTRAGP